MSTRPRIVEFAVPGDRYGGVVLREALALVGASALLGGIGLAVVNRRRPY